MEKVNVQAWMSRDDRDRLARLAAEAGRTVSGEVRGVLIRHLEQRSAEKPLREQAAAR